MMTEKFGIRLIRHLSRYLGPKFGILQESRSRYQGKRAEPKVRHPATSVGNLAVTSGR